VEWKGGQQQQTLYPDSPTITTSTTEGSKVEQLELHTGSSSR
jgi:hypothetical protein